ncbi:unnamed protein product [Jaminaea pallidilutea]
MPPSPPQTSTPPPVTAPSPPSPSPSSSFTQRSTKSQIRLKITSRLNEGGELADDEGDSENEEDEYGGQVHLAPRRDDSEGQMRRDETDESDDEEETDSLLERRKIVVKKDWDDSDDDDDEDDEEELDAAEAEEHRSRNPQLDGSSPSDEQRRKTRSKSGPDSYLRTLRPSRERRKTWWRWLTNPAQPNSLSIPHVTLNLFAASLHPSVLLSAPFYFSRTGIALGMIGLALVAVLGGVGGGLWVVLSRYVGGKKTPEAITGASFGRHSKHKSRIGKFIAGSLLATYATGSAFIAYFALADLLLQVFFHYSPKGIPLHDRGFVTIVVGAIFTAPLIIVPLAKRTLIRLSMGTALVLYPIVAAILLAKVFTYDVDHMPPDTPDLVAMPGPSHNGNPFYPPSIWAPYSLLPLLTLSSSPLQILAHNRSLRRNLSMRTHGAQQGSNVKAFLACQALQVLLVVGTIVTFGIGVGTQGIEARLRLEVRPNLFTSLPHDDDLVNVARILFVLLLSTHLALCLAMARSSWARLLKLLHLNPFRWTQNQNRGPLYLSGVEGQPAQDPESGGAADAPSRRTYWGKLARTSLGGALLWALIAFMAYTSGIGGIRRKEKAGEEARYVRASEILGLFGGGVGFVLPGVVWVLLFWIRRQREILSGSSTNVGSGWVSNWVKGPLSVLAKKSSAVAASATGRSNNADYRPVPTWHQERDLGDQEVGSITSQTRPPATEDAEGAAAALGNDDATRILLARKERQLQKRTKGRRLWQDILVLAAVLPFGMLLLIMGAIELARGGF